MNSYATPTPIIEDGKVFVHFGSHGTAALDAQTGEKIWERRDFKCDHFRGAAASPISHNGNIIVHFDGHDYQYIVCMNQKNGKTLWKKERENMILKLIMVTAKKLTAPQQLLLTMVEKN